MHGVGLVAGTVFAGYRIERLLGRGGMGTVYLAAHPRLPRQVALKLLNRDLYAEQEVRARFEREADVAARLDHPGIVSVLDRGVEDGLMWISMQYVDGTDASVFRGRPLDPARAVDIIAQTADALDYAHERDVLHRDVKPANILLAAGRGRDRVLLTDFGIARLRGDARQLTRTGDFLATLAYASPEQLSGATVDHRSDQYSLGCSLYTLLTGESPFPADNPGAVVAAHLTKPVPRASDRVSGLAPGLDAVIGRAMAKDPAERFGSCAEFGQAAAAASDGAAVAPALIGAPQRTGPGLSTREPAMSASAAPSSAPAGTSTTPVDLRTVVAAPPGARATRPHATEVAGNAVSSRWRALAVSLLVLAMIAGVGVVGVGAVYWKFIRPHRVPPAPTWGEHAAIATAFPGLIPTTPVGRGWREAACAPTSTFVVAPGDPTPVRQISCTDADGVVSWFTAYGSAADVENYLARHTLAHDSRTRPDRNSTIAVARPNDPGAPFTLAVGERGHSATAEILIEVSWPGHTFDETYASWFEQAPF
ncbi:serine/threonine-protein kinase [Nocardia caishijiensis]|uniref:non-specific serine/threonine protein kinase n=1 Tax=Nocardia caishijiensis TaxID=184756 RepID=A0ABQ6YK16_9NOCA|nr:serine/threonine-protein kinase [Nocardia caishijiensis]KAF0846134.1 serine/threonine-protein kinase [Nocardia caishijiensis]